MGSTCLCPPMANSRSSFLPPALCRSASRRCPSSVSVPRPSMRGSAPSRNPWNLELTSGGSSAGSAVFVAAGVVPIAHAMDGGGSIRIPASCTGLVGLKPTRGRLPLDKDVSKMPLKVVHNGVLTRSVRDTAAFYREAERIWRNPKLPPIGDVTATRYRTDDGRRDHQLAVPGLQSGGPRADAEDGRAAGRARPPRRSMSTLRPCQRLSPTISCCTTRCWASRWSMTASACSAKASTARSSTTRRSVSSAMHAATCTGYRWRSPGCPRSAGAPRSCSRPTTWC